MAFARLVVVVAVLVLRSPAAARDDGLKTPPMGWMSWERFGCQKDCVNHPTECISADLFEQQANALVKKGFLDAGYNRIDIDDCYLDERDPVTNDLRADEARFPGGIAALSDKIHGLGLKFGVYNDIGRTTCAGNPGLNVSAAADKDADAQLHRDVTLMAHKWKIDSLKVDGCARSDSDPMNVTYPKLGEALNATGRQILFSCSWPVYHILSPDCGGSLGTPACFPAKQIADACSSWRIFKDIMDAYNLPGHAGLRQIIDFYAQNHEALKAVNKPGAYNDYDMLLAGNQGLTVPEAKIQMGLWAMWSAPLLMSNDLRTITDDYVAVLTNKEVIAVDQDPLGASASFLSVLNNTNVMSAQVSLWHKPLADGSRAAALVNTALFDAAGYNLTVTGDMLGFPAGTKTLEARDLWAGKDLGKFDAKAGKSFWLDATSITMLKLTKAA